MQRIETCMNWDEFNTIQVLFLEDSELICQYSLEIREGHQPVLHGVYVYPQSRGKGLFNMMMQDCIELAKSKDENEITLNVREDNFIKQKYAEYGFEMDNLTEERLGFNYEWMTLKINNNE